MKKRLIIALTIGILVVWLNFLPIRQNAESFPPESEYGKCYIAPFREAFKSAETVFVGKVISEEKNGDVRTFNFEAEKLWKGGDAKNIKIDVYENVRYQAWFEVGKKYLVFALPNENGNPRVVRCSRSRELSSNLADLKLLGKAKKPKK